MWNNAKLGIATLELSVSLIVLLPLVFLSVDLNNFYLEKENIDTATNQEIKKLSLNSNTQLTYNNNRFVLAPNYIKLEQKLTEYLNTLKNNSKIDEISAELACASILDKNLKNKSTKQYENLFIYNKSQKEFLTIHQENFIRVQEMKEIEKNINEVGINPRFCSFVVRNDYNPKTYLLLAKLSPSVLKIYTNKSFFINLNL